MSFIEYSKKYDEIYADYLFDTQTSRLKHSVSLESYIV